MRIFVIVRHVVPGLDEALVVTRMTNLKIVEAVLVLKGVHRHDEHAVARG